MKHLSTIDQHSDTHEEAVEWARGFDFSEDDVFFREEHEQVEDFLFWNTYIDTVNGVCVWYDCRGNFYRYTLEED